MKAKKKIGSNLFLKNYDCWTTPKSTLAFWPYLSLHQTMIN